MSKKKKSSVLIESDSDDSDSGKDLEEVTYGRFADNAVNVLSRGSDRRSDSK